MPPHPHQHNLRPHCMTQCFDWSSPFPWFVPRCEASGAPYVARITVHLLPLYRSYSNPRTRKNTPNRPLESKYLGLLLKTTTKIIIERCCNAFGFFGCFRLSYRITIRLKTKCITPEKTNKKGNRQTASLYKNSLELRNWMVFRV